MKHLLGTKIALIFYALAMLILPSACQTANTAAAPPAAIEKFPVVRPGPATSVTLGSGDTVEIKFAYAPQFDQTETVRPDGKIELQLVGEVSVQGKTPSQLRGELMELYAKQLKHPQLAVFVRGFYDRRVYVGGEVKKPGAVLMPGQMSVLDAVMNAGGFNRETAETTNVIVARNIDGQIRGAALNLQGALRGETTDSFYLKPGDIVYVPSTHIVNVDVWVQQHLWQLLPPLGIGANIY
jgi:protein involved in polysaccharide export with SLBB domain